MICPNCKTENADDAIHCINCGEMLNTEAAEANEIKKNERLEEIQKRRQKKNKQKKRNKIIVIALAAAVVIAAVSAVAFLIKDSLFGDGSNSDTLIVSSAPTATPSETPTPLEEESQEPQSSENTEVENWAVATEENTVQTAKPTTEAIKKVQTSTKVPGTAVAKATAKPTKKPTSSVTNATAKPAVSSPGFTAGSVATGEVKQGEVMSSQLVKSNGVVQNQSGEELVKLTIGNSVYYAYNNGQFSSNGYYSIDATASANSFEGVPVYNASNVVSYSADGYILPNSSSKTLTDSDISGLSKSELILARNEIYARHGRTFKKQELQDYFNSKTWYSINKNYNYSNDSLNLNDVEKANVRFLRHKAE